MGDGGALAALHSPFAIDMGGRKRVYEAGAVFITETPLTIGVSYGDEK